MLILRIPDMHFAATTTSFAILHYHAFVFETTKWTTQAHHRVLYFLPYVLALSSNFTNPSVGLFEVYFESEGEVMVLGCFCGRELVWNEGLDG